MAVMLRMLGVPSRVVTGFQSGYFNDVSGLYVVRASDRSRLGGGLVRRGSAGSPSIPRRPHSGRMRTASASGSECTSMLRDSLWSQWVVAYDLGHQAQLASRVASALRRWNQPGSRNGSHWSADLLPIAKRWGGWLIALGLLAVILAISGPAWLRTLRDKAAVRRIGRQGGTPTDASLLYRRMLETLERRGFEKPAFFTPCEFVRQLPAA